jgi:hypothetical protein
VRGGLGFANITSSVTLPGTGTVTDEDGGFALTGGLGYAFWLGSQFNLTVNLDFSGQRYGGSGTAPDSSSFWALGLGFDWY